MLSHVSQTIYSQEEGQMLVEYLLMLSLLVVLVLVAFGMYVEPLGEIYTNIEETFHNITHGIRF